MNKKFFIFISVAISTIIISFIYTLIIGYQSSIKDDAINAIKSSLSNSTELTYERLNKLNGISQQIIYENTIQNLYASKVDNNTSNVKFSHDISSLLGIKQYPYNEILMSAAFFNNNPEKIYFSSNSKDFERKTYTNKVHQEVIKILEDGNTNINFLSVENRFYIFRNLVNNSKLNQYGGYVIEVDTSYITEYFLSTVSKNIFVELQINNQVLILSEDNKGDIILLDKNDYYNNYEFHQIANAYETKNQARLFNVVSSANANNIFMYRYEYQFINFYILAIILIVILMCSLIFYYIYKNEIAFLDIKVKSLQSQINPHFLNNAFEIINWTARIEGNYEISKMIDALSTVINSSLDRENNRFNTLEKELEIVDSYLFLIEKRFNEKIKIDKTIDNKLNKVLLPKLTIQPIVENAIKHGIEKIGEGTIFIRVYEYKSTVNIEIENNGAVITAEDEKKIKKLLNQKTQSSHIGINNVNTRIKYIFGKNYGLTIKRLENNNSMSKITLPST